MDDKLTIDQLKEIKEQYCKYKCELHDGCFNDYIDSYHKCQINNFIEELYQNGLLKI